MATVASSSSFRVSLSCQRKKIKQEKQHLKANEQTSLRASKNLNKPDLYSRLIACASTIGSFILLTMSVSSRIKMINPIFIPMQDRDIVVSNDSICFYK